MTFHVIGGKSDEFRELVAVSIEEEMGLVRWETKYYPVPTTLVLLPDWEKKVENLMLAARVVLEHGSLEVPGPGFPVAKLQLDDEVWLPSGMLSADIAMSILSKGGYFGSYPSREAGHITDLMLKAPSGKGIVKVASEVTKLLLDKNAKYGDSALFPARIFSKADTVEQLNVRIDDKINRIRQSRDGDIEDVELDLIGYLILKRVATNA